jgi:carbamoyl-phosphate synthase large subunit
VFPAQRLYVETTRQIRRIGRVLARELAITGPFNVQFLARDNIVKVIECNLRASRSVPFVSKVAGINFAAEATRCMLGVRQSRPNGAGDLDYVGVKAPMFSFARIAGADPMLGVEMASTGEVGCLGQDVHEALLHALIATGFRFPRKGVLLSLGPLGDKYDFADDARAIGTDLGLPLYATPGTAKVLNDVGIPCQAVAKLPGDEKTAMAAIAAGDVDLIINIPTGYDDSGRPDGYLIRRCAADFGVPLITDRSLARAVILAMRAKRGVRSLPINSYDEHVMRSRVVSTRRVRGRIAR